jgi:hypothetical protein
VSVDGSWRDAQFLGDEPRAEVLKPVFLEDRESGLDNVLYREIGALAGLPGGLAPF